ncbi:tetratricopeptide repeat protein [bacterium]|nr:tetratricopeptide repeat protein [bacterium]
MRIFIFFLFLCFFWINIQALTDVEIFDHLTKIRIEITPITKIEVSENYYKRKIYLKITNPPIDFEEKLLAYQDNHLDSIKQIGKNRNTTEYEISTILYNFFYDYKIENNQFTLSIGRGRKIIPLKTSHNLVFVPYIFETEPYQIHIDKLKLSPIISTHQVAQSYNYLIKLYEENRYLDAKEVVRYLLRKELTKESELMLRYLETEIDFYLSFDQNASCIDSSLKFKSLIENNREHPYNDRATVFIYKCYLSLDALSDVSVILEKAITLYANSIYYYPFLYANALIDLQNGNKIDFQKKMTQIIAYTKDLELKFYSIYKLYRYYFEENDLPLAYNTISTYKIRFPELFEKYPLLMTSYADTLFYSKSFEAAKEIYDNVILKTANRFLQTYLKMRIADTLLYQFKYSEAIDYFLKEEKAFQGDDLGSSLARIRLLELKGGDISTMLQIFNEMKYSAKEPVLLQETLFRKAQLHFYRGEYLEAYFELKYLLQEYPNTSLKKTATEMMNRIIYGIYYSFFSEKNYIDIAQIYKDRGELISEHPEYYSLIYMIIESLLNLEQYKEITTAVDFVLKTAKRIPFEFNFVYYLGWSYLKLKNYYKSKQALEYLVFRNKEVKNNYRYPLFYGYFWFYQNSIKTGFRFFDKAMEFKDIPKKDKIAILKIMSRFYSKKRAYSPALSIYRELLDLYTPKTKEYNDTLFKIAQMYYFIKDYPKAISGFTNYLTKVNEVSEKNFEARYRLGNAYIYSDDFDKGEKILESLSKEEGDFFWNELSKKTLSSMRYRENLKKLNEIEIEKK